MDASCCPAAAEQVHQPFSRFDMRRLLFVALSCLSLLSVARAADDKMKMDDKMHDDKMKMDDKMHGDKMKMDDKMHGDKMGDDKMEGAGKKM
jgi:hypothetical protein